MKSYRTVKYINGLLPMQYVFLIRSRHEAQPSDVFLTASTRAYQKSLQSALI